MKGAPDDPPKPKVPRNRPAKKKERVNALLDRIREGRPFREFTAKNLANQVLAQWDAPDLHKPSLGSVQNIISVRMRDEAVAAEIISKTPGAPSS